MAVLLISGPRVQMEWVCGQEKRNKMVLERYRLIFLGQLQRTDPYLSQ